MAARELESTGDYVSLVELVRVVGPTCIGRAFGFLLGCPKSVAPLSAHLSLDATVREVRRRLGWGAVSMLGLGVIGAAFFLRGVG